MLEEKPLTDVELYNKNPIAFCQDFSRVKSTKEKV
jgi:hypothetical protein